MVTPERLIAEVWVIAQRAGVAIKAARAAGITVDRKADGSQVTSADLAAERILIEGLAALQSDVPIVSEESVASAAAAFGAGPWWCIDPLDGTRDFAAGGDECCVNIALMQDARPVLGLIHAPFVGATYAAALGAGTLAQRAGEAAPRAVRVRPPPPDGLDILTSARHDDPAALDQVLAGAPVRARIAQSSALKFCRIAAGEADVYLRLGQTGEWDTAAGQILVEAAGGSVTDLATGAPLRYGKPGFLNASFVARGG